MPAQVSCDLCGLTKTVSGNVTGAVSCGVTDSGPNEVDTQKFTVCDDCVKKPDDATPSPVRTSLLATFKHSGQS